MSERDPDVIQLSDSPTDKLVIVKKLGQGGFGVIYHAKWKGQDLAIKKSKQALGAQSLRIEVAVLTELQGYEHFPRLHHSGIIGQDYFYTMDLLGPSLIDLLRSRKKRKFSIPTVALLGLECLKALEIFHSRNLIHRDIKPANFLIGLHGQKHTVFLIDYGLAKRVKPSEMTERREVGFRGTPRYASVFSHQNLELGKVDDLWSLLYMLVEFSRRRLPWSADKDKESIGRRKMEFQNARLVAHLPHQFEEFVNYLNKLRFGDHPNYAFLKGLMEKVVTDLGLPLTIGYDWERRRRREASTPGGRESEAKEAKEEKESQEEKEEGERMEMDMNESDDEHKKEERKNEQSKENPKLNEEIKQREEPEVFIPPHSEVKLTQNAAPNEKPSELAESRQKENGGSEDQMDTGNQPLASNEGRIMSAPTSQEMQAKESQRIQNQPLASPQHPNLSPVSLSRPPRPPVPSSASSSSSSSSSFAQSTNSPPNYPQTSSPPSPQIDSPLQSGAGNSKSSMRRLLSLSESVIPQPSPQQPHSHNTAAPHMSNAPLSASTASASSSASASSLQYNAGSDAAAISYAPASQASAGIPQALPNNAASASASASASSSAPFNSYSSASASSSSSAASAVLASSSNSFHDSNSNTTAPIQNHIISDTSAVLPQHQQQQNHQSTSSSSSSSSSSASSSSSSSSSSPSSSVNSPSFSAFPTQIRLTSPHSHQSSSSSTAPPLFVSSSFLMSPTSLQPSPIAPTPTFPTPSSSSSSSSLPSVGPSSSSSSLHSEKIAYSSVASSYASSYASFDSRSSASTFSITRLKQKARQMRQQRVRERERQRQRQRQRDKHRHRAGSEGRFGGDTRSVHSAHSSHSVHSVHSVHSAHSVRSESGESYDSGWRSDSEGSEEGWDAEWMMTNEGDDYADQEGLTVERAASGFSSLHSHSRYDRMHKAGEEEEEEDEDEEEEMEEWEDEMGSDDGTDEDEGRAEARMMRKRMRKNRGREEGGQWSNARRRRRRRERREQEIMVMEMLKAAMSEKEKAKQHQSNGAEAQDMPDPNADNVVIFSEEALQKIESAVIEKVIAKRVMAGETVSPEEKMDILSDLRVMMLQMMKKEQEQQQQLHQHQHQMDGEGHGGGEHGGRMERQENRREAAYAEEEEDDGEDVDEDEGLDIGKQLNEEIKFAEERERESKELSFGGRGGQRGSERGGVMEGFVADEMNDKQREDSEIDEVNYVEPKHTDFAPLSSEEDEMEQKDAVRAKDKYVEKYLVIDEDKENTPQSEDSTDHQKASGKLVLLHNSTRNHSELDDDAPEDEATEAAVAAADGLDVLPAEQCKEQNCFFDPSSATWHPQACADERGEVRPSPSLELSHSSSHGSADRQGRLYEEETDITSEQLRTQRLARRRGAGIEGNLSGGCEDDVEDDSQVILLFNPQLPQTSAASSPGRPLPPSPSTTFCLSPSPSLPSDGVSPAGSRRQSAVNPLFPNFMSPVTEEDGYCDEDFVGYDENALKAGRAVEMRNEKPTQPNQSPLTSSQNDAFPQRDMPLSASVSSTSVTTTSSSMPQQSPSAPIPMMSVVVESEPQQKNQNLSKISQNQKSCGCCVIL